MYNTTTPVVPTTYIRIYIDGAQKINLKLADVVINWSGGMSQSKKSSCVGFAPVNDTVLGILELLKYDILSLKTTSDG